MDATRQTARGGIALRGISKRFGAVAALAGVDLDVAPGEVHALLGENGAGKTTLLSVLSGLVQPDAGSITIDGDAVTLASPADALSHGVGTVHQHLTLVPTLTVRENLLLGDEGGFRVRGTTYGTRRRDGETERRRDGETERRGDGGTEGRRDGETERRRDGETEGRKDGGTERRRDGGTEGRRDGVRSERVGGASGRRSVGRVNGPVDGLLEEAIGLDLPLEAVVGGLAIGVRQRVEIAKARRRGTRALLLDEPTAVLAPAEVDDLLALLRRLAAAGRAVVLVTHKLDEALAASDRVTVLRAGRVVLSEAIGADREALRGRIVAAMFASGAGGEGQGTERRRGGQTERWRDGTANGWSDDQAAGASPLQGPRRARDKRGRDESRGHDGTGWSEESQGRLAGSSAGSQPLRRRGFVPLARGLILGRPGPDVAPDVAPDVTPDVGFDLGGGAGVSRPPVRDGALGVDGRDAPSTMRADLALGRDEQRAPTAGPGRPVLEVERLSARDDRGAVALDGVSLEVRAGEILGVAGVEGNGQRELAEVLAGQRRPTGGAIRLDGEDVTALGVAGRLEAGIGFLTDERLGEGIVPGASVALNLALKRLTRPPFAVGLRLDRRAIRNRAVGMIAEHGIRPANPDRDIVTLSGGNIQRALVARELAGNPRLLIASKPTAGLDLRTAERILGLLRGHAETGSAVLLISNELDELLATADRVAVLYRGRVAGIVERSPAEGTLVDAAPTEGALGGRDAADRGSTWGPSLAGTTVDRAVSGVGAHGGASPERGSFDRAAIGRLMLTGAA